LILVTGANGFLGEHLLLQLLKDATVTIRAIYRSAIPDYFVKNKFTNLEWCQCDILDVDALDAVMQDVQHVYHCANSISFDSRDADQMYHNNVEGTAAVVNSCLEHRIQKLLYVSSVAAIARAEGAALIAEHTPWMLDANTSQYGISKYKAELEVWRGAAEGLPIVIVNPSVIIGEGDWNKGSSALLKNVYNEFPFYTRGTNGFVDAKDVANSMVQLMNSSITNQRFIINENNYSYQTIFTLMANAFGKQAPRYFAKPWMSSIVWKLYAIRKLFTGKPALITQETAHTADSVFAYDNTKLLQALPQFRYTAMQDTLARVAQYHLEKLSN
jgi:dihydroflavonol-4-reductase